MKYATGREVVGLRHLGPVTMVECDPVFQEERSVLVGIGRGLERACTHDVDEIVI